MGKKNPFRPSSSTTNRQWKWLYLVFLGCSLMIYREIFASLSSWKVHVIPEPETKFYQDPIFTEAWKNKRQALEAPNATEDFKSCYRNGDFGLIEELRQSMRTFCNSENHSSTQVKVTSKISGIRTIVMKNFLLDLTNLTIEGPIESIAQDGNKHNPQFHFQSSMINCACPELTSLRKKKKSNLNDLLFKPWSLFFAKTKRDKSMYCQHQSMQHVLEPYHNDSIEISEKVVLISRKHDHNPFFQVSSILNAWVMVTTLEWDIKDVRLMYVDAAFPSAVEELAKQLLSPYHPVLKIDPIQGQRIHFLDEAVVVPWEMSGPMMHHLNDDEPCHDLALFHTFRHQALRAMKVTRLSDPTGKKPLVATIISRRDYEGRHLQRKWFNEAEILTQMREKYGNAIIFDSVDFVELSLREQMHVILNSDIVIGMHGAGMVNVMWTRPGTLVIEIFPKEGRRWGYRNLCQYLGCDWHDFRGGIDTSSDPRASGKILVWEEWLAFVDPMLRTRLPQ